MAATSLVSVANVVTSLQEDNGVRANRVKTKDDQYYAQIIGRLTDALLKKLTNSKLCGRFTSDPTNYIEQRLYELSPTFHTPNHPTYAMMIQRALDGLKEEGGSTKEAISKFIKENYEGLPLAHKSLLSLHLEKLCQRGEIICSVSGNRYMLPSDSLTEIPCVKGTTRKRKVQQDREKISQHKIENGDQSQEQQMVAEEKRPLKLVIRRSFHGRGNKKEIVFRSQGQIMQSKHIRDREEWNGWYVQRKQPEVEDDSYQAQRSSYEETSECAKMEAQQAEVEKLQEGEFETEVIESQDGAGRNEIDAEGRALSQDEQINASEEEKHAVAEQINDEEQQIEVDEEINQEHGKKIVRLSSEDEVKEQCVEESEQLQVKVTVEGQKVEERQSTVEEKNEVQRNQVEEIGQNDSEGNRMSEVVFSMEQQAETIKGHNLEMIDEQHYVERCLHMNEGCKQSGQSQEHSAEFFIDQNHCLEQQNRQHKQICVKETAVMVVQQRAAEWENIACEKQILEQGNDEEIQEQYQTKGLEIGLDEGKKQAQNIRRIFQLQEEQIEVITNIIKQEAQQKVETAKLNMLQGQMNSGCMHIDTSVPELSQKQEKVTNNRTTSGSFAIQKSAYHGSLPPFKICIELLKRNKMIEEKLLEVMNLRNDVEESNCATRNPIVEFDELNLHSHRTCGDREYMNGGLSVQKRQQAFSQTGVDQPCHGRLTQVYGPSVMPPECQLDILQSENTDKEKPKELEPDELIESCLDPHQLEWQLLLSSCSKGKSTGCYVGDQQPMGITIQQKPSEFESTANEQSCQTKQKMWRQQELRQLRPEEQWQYSHDCAESKAAGCQEQQEQQEQGGTIEFETIMKFQKLHLVHNIELPNLKGPQQSRPMLMEDLLQPLQEQTNSHKKGDNLNSQPIVQGPYLPPTSQILKANFQSAIKPPQNKRAAMRDLSQTQEEPKQKRQQHIPLDFWVHNASQHGPAAQETVILALPSPYHFEQARHFQHQVQENPSQSSLDSSTMVGESLPSGKLCDEKHFSACHNHKKLGAIGEKRCLRSRTRSETAEASLCVDNQSIEHNQLEKHHIKRRGRPPKPKQGTIIMTKVLLSAMHHKQQGPLKRLGRPPKSVHNHAEVDAVNSQNQQQLPKHRGRGRPRKVTEGT